MKRILIVMSLFVFLCVTGCNEKNIENSVDKPQNNGKIESKEEVYGLNDLIELESSEGKMNLRFLSVTETKERNEFEDNEYKKVIFIIYQYENINLNDDFYIDEDNFKVYDKSNKILDTYPLDVEYAPAISAGRNATHKIAYGLNNDNNYIEIELRSQNDNKYFNKKVILEW